MTQLKKPRIGGNPSIYLREKNRLWLGRMLFGYSSYLSVRSLLSTSESVPPRCHISKLHYANARICFAFYRVRTEKVQVIGHLRCRTHVYHHHSRICCR